MRIIFTGTPDFSVFVLKVLVEVGHQVIAVVAQPDKPKGRGKEVQMTPMKIQAMGYGIPVYQPAKVREASFVEVLQGMGVDVYVVIAFGQLLPKAALELPKYGCINIHVSLLSKYRGVAPIQWCVIDGERETGTTTMMMDVGLDTGDMLGKTVVPIEEKKTGGSLHDKLSLVGEALILSTLKKLEEGTLIRTSQTDRGICYVKMLTKSLGDIDWNQSAMPIERLIRGSNPWPSAYTLWNGKTIKVWSADVTTSREATAFLFESGVPSETGITPGIVVCSDKHSLVVCIRGDLPSVRELQVEGKKRMDVPASLRRYPIPEGDVFVKKESD